jgi:hypothetical protein
MAKLANKTAPTSELREYLIFLTKFTLMNSTSYYQTYAGFVGNFEWSAES